MYGVRDKIKARERTIRREWGEGYRLGWREVRVYATGGRQPFFATGSEEAGKSNIE